MRLALAVLALALILMPPAQAGFVDSREWTGFSISYSDADGVVADTSFSLNGAPHGFTVSSRTTSVTFSAQFTTTPASAGNIDEYMASLVIKESGTTRITCGTISFSRLAIPDLGRFQSTFIQHCQGTGSNALVPGTTYTYGNTVTMVSGTNHAVQVSYAFRVTQTDSFTDANLEPLAKESTLISRSAQTNTLINTTHTHLDSHFSTTWSLLDAIHDRLNTTCQKTLYAMDGCEGFSLGDFCTGEGSNCTISVDNSDVLTELESSKVQLVGLDSDVTWNILIFGALILWALHRKWWIVATVATVGVLAAVSTQAVWASVTTVLFLIIAYWLELLITNKRKVVDQEEDA